jgi:hypothetical protein
MIHIVSEAHPRWVAWLHNPFNTPQKIRSGAGQSSLAASLHLQDLLSNGFPEKHPLFLRTNATKKG